MTESAASSYPIKATLSGAMKNSLPLRVAVFAGGGLAVVAFVIGIVVWRKGDAGAPVTTGQVNVPSAPAVSSVPGSANSTEVYDNAVTLDNERRAKEAREQGTSNIPTMTSRDRVNERTVPAATVTQSGSPDNSAAMANLMAEQFGRLVADWRRAGAGGGNVIVVPPATALSNTVPATETQATKPSAAMVRIPAGRRWIARLNDELVSTRLGYPTTATILAGEMDGATLLSSVQRATNDRIAITFNAILPKGASKSIPLSAEAVDVNGLGGGVATDVDHHTFANVVGTAMAVGLGAYATGLTRTQQQIGVGANGGVVTADTGFDTARARDYAFAQSGAAVAQRVQALGNQPPTITATSGTLIGVVVTVDVEFPLVASPLR